MTSDWKEQAKFVQNILCALLINQEWILPQNSDKEAMLFDHLVFLLTTDKKLILSKDEETKITKITETCIEDKSELLNEVRISLICTYVHLDEGKCALVPLIRFQRQERADYHFIDHTGKCYETWENFKCENSWRGYAIALPQNGTYIKENDLYYLDSRTDSNENQLTISNVELQQFNFNMESLKNSVCNVNNIMNYLEEHYFQSVEFNYEHFTKSLKLALYKNIVQIETSTFTSNIKRKNPELNVLDMLHEGFTEITGHPRAYLGNAYFIRDILRNFIQNKRLKDIKHSDGNLLHLIPNGLILHAKALIQLTPTQLELVFLSQPNFSDSQLKHYRFSLESESIKHEKEVCNSLKIQSIDEFTLNGKHIFEDALRFQRDNLYSVMFHSCHEFDPTYIDLGVEFAKRMKCKNIDKFSAALEYAVIKLDGDEIWSKIKLLEDKPPPELDTYISEVKEEFLKENNILLLEGKFRNLMTEYENFCDNGTLHFCCSMTAASHFAKHILKENIPKTFKEYIELARSLTSRSSIAFTWSQDGSSKRFSVIDEEQNLTGIRYENSDGSSFIATTFYTKLKKKRKKKRNPTCQ